MPRSDEARARDARYHVLRLSVMARVDMSLMRVIT